MNPLTRILFFFLLPFVAMMAYPPAWLLKALWVVGLALATFVVMAIFLWRGKSLALTFVIFMQGLNVIIRLMVFYRNAVPMGKTPDPLFIVTCLAGAALSFYLMLRLDKPDIRIQMTG